MIDYAKLNLGDELTESQCTEILGIDRYQHPEKFALKLLALKAEVEQAMKAKFGRIITVRATQHGLQILTDQASAAYNPKRFSDGLRIARRAHRRLLGVDPGKLSPRQKEEFARAVTQQAAKLAMMRQKPPDAELQPVVNDRPRMFPLPKKIQ